MVENKYKIVALDIDGTLINDNFEIPSENIETIQELKSRGVHFIIVTGRPDIMAKQYVEQLKISAPVIGCNGASTRDVVSNELIDIAALSNEQLEVLWTLFKTNKMYPRFYSTSCVYFSNPNEFDDLKNPFAKNVELLKKYMEVKIISDISEITDNNIQIVKIMYPNLNVEKIDNIISQIAKIKSVESVKASETCIDIMKKGISKATALLKYANSMGVEANEIIAIGDGENDIEMLKAVGFAITLENANEKVKSVANMITSSNNDAGVAKALKQIFN